MKKLDVDDDATNHDCCGGVFGVDFWDGGFLMLYHEEEKREIFCVREMVL